MEVHSNTYKLNHKNKEYILNVSLVGNAIRIICKDSLNDNISNYSRDFTLDELKRLDQIFEVIKTPLEALDYIDKALNMEKVGVTEEDGALKIKFYITTKGVVHQLEIPLGKTGVSSTNANLRDNYNLGQTTFGQDSQPTIGPVQGGENEYLSQFNNINAGAFNQINSNGGVGINTAAELVEGYSNVNNSGNAGNDLDKILGNLQNAPFSNDVTTNQYGAALSDLTTQLGNNLTYGTQDYTSQFTNDAQNINQFAENSKNIFDQFNNETNDLTNQYSGDIQGLASQYMNNDTNFSGEENTSEQYSNILNQLNSNNNQNQLEPPYISPADQLEENNQKTTQNNQFLQPPYIGPTDQLEENNQKSTQNNQFLQPPYIGPTDQLEENNQKTTQNNQFFQPPYIGPTDQLEDKLPIYNLENPYLQPAYDYDNKYAGFQGNQFYQTKTTRTTKITRASEKAKQPEGNTFSLNLPLVRDEPKPKRDSLKHNVRRNIEIRREIVNQQSNVSNEKIVNLETSTNTLKNEHQLIQDKLNSLVGQINSYRKQLNSMGNPKNDSEVTRLKAENKAIKEELAELNNLRKDAAEVNYLRRQMEELGPLRRKCAEVDALKGQLGELDELRRKCAELDSVKAQIEELKVLKQQIAQMNSIKQQLGDLEGLRAKVAELSKAKLQLRELNSLREQVAQINVLKQQLNELNKLKMNQMELRNLKDKLFELEKAKIQYELEIKKLRETQKRNEAEQTRIMESQKIVRTTQSKVRNTGLESRNILFEESSQQVSVRGEIIHNTDELEFLTRKMNRLGQKLTLNLLYKASADSDKAAAFHDKCDGARSTLVLIETDKGKRFGGFTNCSWSGDCLDKKDEEAFIFSLDKMQIYENIPGEDAIGCYPKFGPIFMGCQIRIYDNAFTKGGTTFEKGLNYNTEEDYELTGGERTFNVKDIEVYEVIRN